MQVSFITFVQSNSTDNKYSKSKRKLDLIQDVNLIRAR